MLLGASDSARARNRSLKRTKQEAPRGAPSVLLSAPNQHVLVFRGRVVDLSGG